MTGDALCADVATINYIRSDYAFNDARVRGCWQVLTRWITGRDPYLLSFHQVVGKLPQTQIINRGLQDIPLRHVVGSMGREKEFTRQFFPLTTRPGQKERWRTAFALTLCGTGYHPIEACEIDGLFFVINGHQRVSVARYLNWKTIQAHVSQMK